jgi:tetratricopeptide (TPR) repeat protein
LHQPQSAIELAIQALKTKPDAGAIWNTLGLAYLRAKDYDKSIEALEKSRQTPASDEYDLTFLAMAHWHKGESEKAAEYLNTANAMYAKRETKPNKELERFLTEASALMVATNHSP